MPRKAYEECTPLGKYRRDKIFDRQCVYCYMHIDVASARYTERMFCGNVCRVRYNRAREELGIKETARKIKVEPHRY